YQELCVRFEGILARRFVRSELGTTGFRALLVRSTDHWPGLATKPADRRVLGSLDWLSKLEVFERPSCRFLFTASSSTLPPQCCFPAGTWKEIRRRGDDLIQTGSSVVKPSVETRFHPPVRAFALS